MIRRRRYRMPPDEDRITVIIVTAYGLLSLVMLALLINLLSRHGLDRVRHHWSFPAKPTGSAFR